MVFILLVPKSSVQFTTSKQTFRQREDYGIQMSAELLVVHQVLVIVGHQQRVVSHHLIVEGNGCLTIFFWMGHPQCVGVLLVTHGGHVLPDFTQGTAVILHPQELQRERTALLRRTQTANVAQQRNR